MTSAPNGPLRPADGAARCQAASGRLRGGSCGTLPRCGPPRAIIACVRPRPVPLPGICRQARPRSARPSRPRFPRPGRPRRAACSLRSLAASPRTSRWTRIRPWPGRGRARGRSRIRSRPHRPGVALTRIRPPRRGPSRAIIACVRPRPVPLPGICRQARPRSARPSRPRFPRPPLPDRPCERFRDFWRGSRRFRANRLRAWHVRKACNGLSGIVNHGGSATPRVNPRRRPCCWQPDSHGRWRSLRIEAAALPEPLAGSRG